MRTSIFLTTAIIMSCSSPNTSLKTGPAKEFTVVRATQERKLGWFMDSMSRTASGADSAKYSPRKLVLYYEGDSTTYNGAIKVSTEFEAEYDIGKRYDKAHEPITFRNDGNDELNVTDATDETYKCDSILDYGNKLVCYYNSSKTVTLTNFKKFEFVIFLVDTTSVGKAMNKPLSINTR